MLKKITPFLLLFAISTPAYASGLSTGWYTITATNPLFRMSSETEDVQFQYATNKANQKFQLVKIEEDVYRIGTGNTAGMYVLTADGDNIVQEKYNKADNQKWRIKKTEKGNYTIQSADKYLSYSSLRNKALLSLDDDLSEFRIVPYTEKPTVTFKDGDETVARKSVIKGGSVEYSLSNKDGFIFEGWDIDLSEVKGNTTANAIWREAKTYKVTFMDGDEILSDTYVEAGKKAAAPDLSEKEGFEGWDKGFDDITEDLIINAVYGHVHSWEPVYKTVHHEEISHEEEYQEPYTYTDYVDDYELYCCSKNSAGGYTYGQSIGIYKTKSEVVAAWDAHDYGDDLCYRTHQSPVQKTDYETKTRTVIDKEAYDEEVIDYYKCECGETN